MAIWLIDLTILIAKLRLWSSQSKVKIPNSAFRKIKMLPNFLIVGAPKCGTTSLYKYLMQHPEVYMPQRKEPYYFVKPKQRIGHGPKDLSHILMVDSIQEYLLLFDSATTIHAAVGEASAGYLYFYKESIPHIKETLGDPKIIIILRDPVARAFSSHIHHVRAGRESENFINAWHLQESREAHGWWFGFQLLKVGLYAASIEAFQSSFSNVMVILQDEFRLNTLNTLLDVCSFLGISRSYPFDPTIQCNVNTLPRSAALQSLITKLRHKQAPSFLLNQLSSMNTYKPSISMDDARYIAPSFKQDLIATSMIIDRDLTHWLEQYA